MVALIILQIGLEVAVAGEQTRPEMMTKPFYAPNCSCCFNQDLEAHTQKQTA